MDGYIFFYRSIIESPIFADPWLLKIWVWCLMKATYAPHKICHDSKVISLERGQFLYGRKRALEELCDGKNTISESTFYRKMKILELNGSIIQKTNTKYTLVTVVNYWLYQNNSEFPEQQMNSERTAGEHLIKKKERNNISPSYSPKIMGEKRKRKKNAEGACYDLELYEKMLNSKD